MFKLLVEKIPWRKKSYCLIRRNNIYTQLFSFLLLSSLPPSPSVPLLSFISSLPPSFFLLPGLPSLSLPCPVDWKKGTTWELRVVFLGANEDYCPGNRISGSSEKLCWRDSRSQYVRDLSKEGHMQPNTHFGRSLPLVQGADVIINDLFSVFLSDVRRCKIWAHKIFWKYLTIWVTLLPIFPRTQCLIPYLPPWTHFRGCWRSATAMAHDLFLVEVAGKCQKLTLHFPSFLSSPTPFLPSFRIHIFTERPLNVRQSLLSWMLQATVEDKLLK